MSEQQAKQFVKLLQIARDTDAQTVGMIIAFLLQGNFESGLP
jgi:hypothetical protein